VSCRRLIVTRHPRTSSIVGNPTIDISATVELPFSPVEPLHGGKKASLRPLGEGARYPAKWLPKELRLMRFPNRIRTPDRRSRCLQ
jgi:hypothetical protein